MILKFKYNPDLVKAVKTIPGRRWNPQGRYWSVPDGKDALERVIEVAQEFNLEEILEEAKERLQKIEANISLSSSTEAKGQIEIPLPQGKKLYPFQEAGVEYAAVRDAVLIADEMGLGKTVQAISLINIHKPNKVLVVCPASIKGVWRRELENWLVDNYKIRIVNGGKCEVEDKTIIILNYERLIRLVKFEKDGRYVKVVLPEDFVFDMVIVDEAHYIKNNKSKRSKAVQAVARKAKKKVFLTGTPILNRPVELYPILKTIDYNRWKNYWDFVYRYCGAVKTRWGLDVSGASNLEELQQILRSTCMVRRLKKDVLKELPDKIRQIVEIAPSTRELKAAIKAEAKIRELLEEYIKEGAWDKISKELSGAGKIPFEEIARVRHETAKAKIPFAIEYIETLLESKEKVVVFAHHKVVIDALKEHFADISVSIVGGDNPDKRTAAVKAFQEDENIKLFIASIQAASEGITLTAADVMVFVEMDWTPGRMTQAEDRIHRIGQEAGSVLYYYLVVNNSIDALLANLLVEKQAIIDQALNQ